MLRKSISLLVMSLLITIVVTGCASRAYPSYKTPRATIDTFFTSAVKQDYATSFDCYYAAYGKKIAKADFIKHRKDARVLQSYKVLSVKELGPTTAKAEVMLTWAPSVKLKKDKPTKIKVTEDLVKESGKWKIKVW